MPKYWITIRTTRCLDENELAAYAEVMPFEFTVEQYKEAAAHQGQLLVDDELAQTIIEVRHAQ